MNRITEVTKRDIFDLFRNGLVVPVLFDTELVNYCYFGRLNEIDFLKRLYNLKNMPSIDKRYSNAEQEICMHALNNNDYTYCWVFEDERFNLFNGDDETFLRFICEIFHPAVRDEKENWKTFLSAINGLLQNDGYELFISKQISNHDVYEYRIYQEENGLFIPFSQRNSKEIKNKKIRLSITKAARNQIYQFLERCNEAYQTTDNTGWNYNTTIAEDVFYDIKQFYTPKCYNSQNEYVETNNLKDFIISTSPFYVFDAIEIFSKHSDLKNFESQINSILKLNSIDYQLSDGKMISKFDLPFDNNDIGKVPEIGTKELLQETINYYNDDNIQTAVEKLWDAFERIKTYYSSSSIDKKKSVTKVICSISNGQKNFEDLFEKEFQELTAIGNNYRIRHHETTKIDINDRRHLLYFYRRCYSLLLLIIEFLDRKD